MAKKIIILGANERTKEFVNLHRNFGLNFMSLRPNQMSDFEPTNDVIIVEMSAEDNKTKLEILNFIGRTKKSDMLILSEILTISATRAGNISNISKNLVGFRIAEEIEKRFVEIVPGEKTPERIIREVTEYFKSLSF